jgi:hypothetical protein
MLYKSSKGEVEIDTMPMPYASNALAKLRRSAPERTAEIEALQAHVDKLAAEGGDDENPRAVIGGNSPPPDEPAPKLEGRKAIEVHVADLLSEAGNWADGVALVDQGQADAVGRLCRQLQQAAGIVDDAATKEKKPHNDAITAIATWQNSFTAKGLKKTPDGSLTKAIAATGNLSSAWLRKMDDDRLAREKLAADIALKAAQEASELREVAKVTTDIAVMDRAEDALEEARKMIGVATSIGKERVHVGGGGGFRAMTLRKAWSAHVDLESGGWGAAYGYYRNNPEFMAEFHALIQRWADRDCRGEATRLRGVPGFKFIEDKVAA